MIIIAITGPEAPNERRRFEEMPIRIGREGDNDLVLAGFSCSRYHAEIIESLGQIKIVDLGSTNGLEVEGRKVQEHVLTTGAEIKIGEYTLSFTIPQVESKATMMMDAAGMQDALAQAKAELEKPKLIYLNVRGKSGQQAVKIASGVEYVIGRSAGCDIVVDDKLCSGRHCMVSFAAGEFQVKDLESANGTRVNGEAIQTAAIKAGDSLSLGKTTIEVADQPVDTVDEDALMAKTRIGQLPPLQAPAAPEPPAVEPGAEPGAPAVPPARPRPVPTEPEPGPIPRSRLLMIIAAVVVVGIVGIAGLGMIGGGDEEQAAAPTPAPAKAEAVVQVSTAERKFLELSVSAAGTIEPQKRITVSAEIAARVQQFPVGEGSLVKRGDLLVKLDDRQIRLQIQEASSAVTREQVDLAKDDYERKERLFNDGTLTRSAYDQAKSRYLSLDATYTSTQARIAQLREHLSKTRVTSPISGVVARTNIDVGEYAGPGMPLVVLENAEEVLVTVEMPDRDIVKVRPMQVVEAVSDAYPDRIFLGVVERVGTTANPVSKGFEVEARIENSDGQLRSGMITTLRILVDKRNCLVVPQEALLDASAGEAEIIVVRGGVASRIRAGLGARIDRDVEIVSGLDEGDEVVIYGHEHVGDGEAVKTYDRS